MIRLPILTPPPTFFKTAARYLLLEKKALLSHQLVGKGYHLLRDELAQLFPKKEEKKEEEKELVPDKRVPTVKMEPTRRDEPKTVSERPPKALQSTTKQPSGPSAQLARPAEVKVDTTTFNAPQRAVSTVGNTVLPSAKELSPPPLNPQSALPPEEVALLLSLMPPS